jgi:hypothetical protein
LNERFTLGGRRNHLILHRIVNITCISCTLSVDDPRVSRLAARDVSGGRGFGDRFTYQALGFCAWSSHRIIDPPGVKKSTYLDDDQRLLEEHRACAGPPQPVRTSAKPYISIAGRRNVAACLGRCAARIDSVKMLESFKKELAGESTHLFRNVKDLAHEVMAVVHIEDAKTWNLALKREVEKWFEDCRVTPKGSPESLQTNSVRSKIIHAAGMVSASHGPYARSHLSTYQSIVAPDLPFKCDDQVQFWDCDVVGQVMCTGWITLGAARSNRGRMDSPTTPKAVRERVARRRASSRN